MATDELVLTVDGGGSSVKATVFSASNHRLVARVRREYRAARSPDRGRVEFDPVIWWATIMGACREAVEQAGAPSGSYAGVTCTGMRAPFVLVDAAGEELGGGVLVPDRRGADYLAEIDRTIGAQELYRRTGHWLSSRFGLSKLLWFLHEAPQVLSRTRHLLQFHDWLLFRLSGVILSEPSSASMSQLLDVRQRRWAGDVLEALGLSDDLLPPLADAGTVAGGLRPGVAAELGLLTHTPVHVGGGDTHVGALGAGATECGAVAVVAGSTTAIQLTDRSPPGEPSDAAPLVSAHLRPGNFAHETNAGETGVVHRWLSEAVAPGAGPDAIEHMIADAPIGSGGVMVTAARPRWGQAAWSRLAPVTLFGAGPGQPVANLVRAAVENAAYATAAAIGSLLEARTGEVRIWALGGASQSKVWCQTLADVLGRRLEVAQVPDAAARAGALLVCPGAGQTKPEPMPIRVFEPAPERHAVYAELSQRYRYVFERLDEAFGEPA